MTNSRWLAIVCGLILLPCVSMHPHAHASKTIKRKKSVNVDPNDTRTQAQRVFDQRFEVAKPFLQTGIWGSISEWLGKRPRSEVVAEAGGDFRDTISGHLRFVKAMDGRHLLLADPKKDGVTFGRKFEQVQPISGRDLVIARVPLIAGGDTYLLDARTGEETAGPFFFGGYLPNKEAIEKVAQFFQDSLSYFAKSGGSFDASKKDFDISKFTLPNVDPTVFGEFTKLMTGSWDAQAMRKFFNGDWSGMGVPKMSLEDAMFKNYTGVTIVEKEDGTGKVAWIFPMLSMTPTRVDLRTGYEKPMPEMPWMSLWKRRKILPVEWH